MAKAKNKRKPTLRQRLRESATSEIEIVRNKVVDVVAKIAGEHDVATVDLLKFAADGEKTSVKQRMVTRMANAKEAELEALYNKQLSLPVEENTGD